MFDVNKYNVEIIQHLKQSFLEDVQQGDHTSLSCIDSKSIQNANLLVKEDAVIAGIEVAQFIVQHLSNTLSVSQALQDGVHVQKGDVAFYISGSALEILTLERLILNYMQRMSGIATQTNRYANKIAAYKTKVLDTRKTTPGFRVFEKWAVSIGGGLNHRFGLFDRIMIKDNHVDYAGGIQKAIERVHIYLQKNALDLPIEIEVRNIDELSQVLQIGKVHRIMLDNFDVQKTKQAVELIDQQFEIESSGGITFDNIEAYAACGVDFISVGALTHQLKSIDLSLKAC